MQKYQGFINLLDITTILYLLTIYVPGVGGSGETRGVYIQPPPPFSVQACNICIYSVTVGLSEALNGHWRVLSNNHT